MGPRILLVDDERGFLDYTSRRLRARGLSVDTATSGAEAIDKVRQVPVDVVVLDILMPGMDGVETLKELKRIRPEVQVVMLTGHGTQETAEQGREHGALFYLLKPADFSSLLSAIDAAFEEGQPAAEAHRGPGENE